MAASSSSNDNIKVAIKVRPLIKRELDARQSGQWRIQGDTIECTNPMYPNNKFSFGKRFLVNSISDFEWFV